MARRQSPHGEEVGRPRTGSQAHAARPAGERTDALPAERCQGMARIQGDQVNSTWGVYPVTTNRPKKPKKALVGEPPPLRYYVRWRVDGVMRKRSFTAKGHADTFRERLVVAKVMGWDADGRGWPVDPTQAVTTGAVVLGGGLTFEEYANTWYDIRRSGFRDKNRRAHRDNLRFAIAVLRYGPQDPRLSRGGRRVAGGSILMDDLVADDVIRAISVRLTTNKRTAASNLRRIREAYEQGLPAVDLPPERASRATVRGFYITTAMIITAARESSVIEHNPLVGTARHAPPSKPSAFGTRFVPSVDEVFDLADAISQLGPLLPNGRHAGDRFAALVLTSGTLGPRPGEQVAHKPDWIDWDGLAMRFEQSAGRVYDPEEGIRGLQLNSLKHREEGDFREVPMLADVADALRTHIERGYATPDRTWTGVSGTAALDWSNMKDVYWRPALEKVFGGSGKPQLVTMQPKMLRKAAITFWLDSGIGFPQAAEWAGHSEDVSKKYYAGRSSATYQREAGLLAMGHKSAIDNGAAQRMAS